MIQIQNGNGGNGGSTPTPQPAELNIYSKDGSIDVIDEYDENDEPTGWKNIQRVNDLSAEELEAGAMVLMNFAEEDIVKKQQTYIISTNNGRRIEVTFSGAYTIESLQDVNISVRGDVGDDDMCMIRMYMDPGDDQGNRYQGYFFMIWFAGPYQYTQNDDDAFYMSANTDRSLINWMWNGLSNAAVERLEEVDSDMYYLTDFAEGGGEPETNKCVLSVDWDTPNPDYLFVRPAIMINNRLEFVKYVYNRDRPYTNHFIIEAEAFVNGYLRLDESFKLNATVKDSGLRTIRGVFDTPVNFTGFLLTYRNAPFFAAYLESFVPNKNMFPFSFQFSSGSKELDLIGFFKQTAIEEGFMPDLQEGITGNPSVSCEEMFAYCLHMSQATLILNASYFKTLFRTFKGCTALETVTLHNGNRNGNTIGLRETFSGCTALETVTFQNFVIESGYTITTTDCFLNCNSLNEIILSNCSELFVQAIRDAAPAGVTITVN